MCIRDSLVAGRQRDDRNHEQHHAGPVGMQVETQDVLEIGETVVAPESHIVAEEREHQGVGERLCDD